MAKFEEQYQQLQQIVDGLEKGDKDLDSALEEFKKGIALVKELHGKLEKAENELKIIDDDFKEYRRQEAGES